MSTSVHKTSLRANRPCADWPSPAPSAAQSTTTTARTDWEAVLESITQRRLTIQFAADAEWPWHDPASAGLRKEFHLPPGGPFTG